MKGLKVCLHDMCMKGNSILNAHLIYIENVP